MRSSFQILEMVSSRLPPNKPNAPDCQRLSVRVRSVLRRVIATVMPIVMAKEILMNEEGIQKVTSELISTASAAEASASTPEEAYKRFMTVAGKGMMQVMADALAGAVSDAATKTAAKPEIAGWEKFVKGVLFHWTLVHQLILKVQHQLPQYLITKNF
jgi:hypothetical protein